MRGYGLIVVVVFLALTVAAMGQKGQLWLAEVAEDVGFDIGTVTLDLKSGGADSLTFDPGTVPATIPIELYVSAATGGVDRLNNGVHATYADILGSAMEGVMQSSMAMESTFTDDYLPGVNGNLGFDLFVESGAPTYGGIGGLGGAQSPPGSGPSYDDMPGAFTANAPHANGRPPVAIATGHLYLDRSTMNQGGNYFIETDGVASFWEMNGNVGMAIIAVDTLPIMVGPPTAGEDDLDGGQSVVLDPGGGSGEPTEDALVEVSNVSGADDAWVTVTEKSSPDQGPSGGFSAVGTALEVETSLADGELFMTVIIPFGGDDLGGRSPLAVDLSYYNEASESWVLAVAMNVADSPGHAAKVGDRSYEMGDASGPLSSELGDYGVFWNPIAEAGFVWANVDHASVFSRAVHEVGSEAARCDLDGDGDVDGYDFLTFSTCYNGPSRPLRATCPSSFADITGDGSVDGDDFVTFVACYNASLRPPQCE